MEFLITLCFIIGVMILLCIKQINQYERGILYTTGKFTKVINPGWFILIPIFQSFKKIDIRTKTLDVPNQDAITRDNIPVAINAVIYFRVMDPDRAVNEVEDFMYATSQLAQTTMRNSVGEFTLDQLLQERHIIAQKVLEIVDKASDAWGIDVQSVELKDIVLPESLKRTIAKVAEAEREKKSVIIGSEGEVLAAENLGKAANILAQYPGALHLRTLQSINDISSDQSNTTVWMLPVEVLKAMEGLGNIGKR